MSDVFISYSRRDIDFVRHLFDQLKARDRDAWADWQDIPPTADWLAEIYSGIESANTFLFVINPESVPRRDIAEPIPREPSVADNSTCLILGTEFQITRFDSTV